MWESAGIGMLGSVVGNKIGMGMQLNQQRELQKMQIDGQKEMGKYNKMLAMQMWEDTNYKAQVKQMEKAGLNVGLMYGGQGQGGQTNVSPGNVSGSNAEMPKISEGMGMGLQAQATQSQIEVNKAQTEKIKAETGEVTARTPTYAKGMERTDQEISEMASRMNVNVETMKKILQEIEESKSRIDVNTQNIEESKSDINVNNASINKMRTEINRINTLTPVEKKNIETDTIKKYEDIKQGWQKLSIEERKNTIEQFKAEMKVKYPSISEATGRVGNGVINALLEMLGGAENDYKRSYKIPE